MGSHQTILEKQVRTPMNAFGHQVLEYLETSQLKYLEPSEMGTTLSHICP